MTLLSKIMPKVRSFFQRHLTIPTIIMFRVKGLPSHKVLKWQDWEEIPIFVKSRTSFGAYKGLQKLTDFDMIVRYKARFNYVAETGELPIAEKFFMGGIGSVRGYQRYSFSEEAESIATAMETDLKSGGHKRFQTA
jgi:hypothetical protein